MRHYLTFPSIAVLCSCLLTTPTSATTPQAILSEPSQFAQSEFDYVIVGGGIAGLVVATRLSEDENVTVGVIEAGNYKSNDFLIDIPAQFGQVLGNHDYDWDFKSVPQVALGGRAIEMPAGKAVGGSSLLSAFTWHRASSVEYDQWATTFQNGDEWNFQSLLPYFKKVESWTPPPIVFPAQQESLSLKKAMGTSGPLPISYNNFYPEVVSSAVSSLNALGVPTNSDPNSGHGTGISNTARTVNPANGIRSTVANSYLAGAGSRSNLFVLQNAVATKIRFDPESSVSSSATSVDVDLGEGQGTFSIKTKKEIILAAGAIKTPQLLELSGIGDKALLESLGIETIVDLPAVGENLQDPGLTMQEYVVNSGVMTLDALRLNQTFLQEQQGLFFSEGTGALSYTTPDLAEISLTLALSEKRLAESVELVHKSLANTTTTPLGRIRNELLERWMKSNEVGWAQMFFIPAGMDVTSQEGHVMIGSVDLHPLSAGNVHIDSTNPWVEPKINPNYFDNPFDSQLHAHMMTAGLNWASTPPLSKRIRAAINPPWNITSFDALKEYASKTLVSSFHYTSTTAMAPKDIGGVVDGTLKVHGISNVRVVGPGIIPMALGAAPQHAVYAIAEKAADMIKAAWEN